MLVPHYVKAICKDQLIDMMTKNNVDDSINYSYFNICKDGNFWIAWYNKEINYLAEVPLKKPKKGKVKC